MTLDLNEILNCVGGNLIVEGRKKSLNGISIDTRKISNEEIFLAVSGENSDGNKYVIDAIKKNVKLCIIDKSFFSCEELQKFDVSVILVENTLHALGKLAILVRNKLDINIIGVTGSVGKTTTKDLIFDFLSCGYKVYKNSGNLNNHLGMPISLINISDDAEVGIFELGMSNLGEIDHLSNILRPNIAVITNIGVNHIEFLKTKENILKAKSEIVNYFNEEDILILNNEDDELKNCKFGNKFKIFRVGIEGECDFRANEIKINLDSVEFECTYLNSIEKVSIKVVGKHNILNSLIALKICEILKVPMNLMRKKFNDLCISSMRQEIFKHNNMILINDCYNASPSSMKSGIDVLSLYDGEKVCIFGDMLELGENSGVYHQEVAEYSNGKINKLIAIGKFKNFYFDGFEDKDNCFCFENFEDFEFNIKKILKGNENILIKASRSSKFEKVINIIMDKF